MAIVWTPPPGWVEETGASIRFTAPCDCSQADSLVIGSNTYSFVDAVGNAINKRTGSFAQGAVLEVLLDCENKRAYLNTSGRPPEVDWTALGLSSSVKVSASDRGRHTNGDMFYKVVDGNHVYVAFNCAFTYAGSAIYANATQIPAAYRPARNVYAMCAVGGRSTARIVVTSTGHVVIDWVQVISAAEATTSAEVSWIDGYIDYWI